MKPFSNWKKVKRRRKITGKVVCVRKSKRAVLDLFKERFKNVSGLTIQRTHSQDSVELYVTKEETRLEGPFYAGNKIKFDLELANSMELKPWQQDLFDLMKNHEEFLRDRKVIYVKDDKGGSGKSTFLKYLCSQKDGLNFKKLPLDRPDRIRMMVCKITEKEDVDAFAFDFTRTMDENTSIKSMFQVLEEIKNGHIVSAMFGAPLESIIPCPFVLIFTNEDISGYYHYLSKDRWQVYAIIEGELLAIKKFEPHDRNNRYVKLTKPEGKN